jgi:TolB protein
MRDGNTAHLFTWQPGQASFMRLTDSPSDEIDPAISPDGKTVALTSRSNGYWDLYLLDLTTGARRRLTDSLEYDGSPAWSPDGQWLAYESYQEDNLEILIRPVASEPGETHDLISLTDDPAIDHSPAWSPDGRSLAFVSTRAGSADIWLASLDGTGSQFENISRTVDSSENDPKWSPDGRYLAWTAHKEGVSSVWVWDSQQPDLFPYQAGSGQNPVWSPDGASILVELERPNSASLIVYMLTGENGHSAPINLPGALYGLDWSSGAQPDLLAGFPKPAGAELPADLLWQALLTTESSLPGGRAALVPVADITAPYTYLHDAVDESFIALRRQTGLETGWDLLSGLENAYLPLTEPLLPGESHNWLQTGRAFAVNPLPLNAGWIAVVREEFEGQVYWRVYLKARYQDGSQGRPLEHIPWDMTSRYEGDPEAYDKGGRLADPLAGYWIDFTELAARYGWERLPAQSNWRTFFPAARFNQFVLTGGLDWARAMAEIYPPEAMVTATSAPTRTTGPSPVETEVGTFTPSPSPLPSLTPTFRPTWTPAP